MSVTSANRYLTRAEMEGNADYIAGVLLGYGWTVSAVAAALGNMETESTINPGIYQSLDSSSTTNGFGLVQWTPNTKYKSWADKNGYEYGDILGQLVRIQYELENGLQWIPTTAYPMSFREFAASNAMPEYLAKAFLYNYERPANLQQPKRGTQARKWYNFITGGGIVPITPGAKSMSKLILYFAGSRRKG